MSLQLESRRPFNPNQPFRRSRPASNKIIFVSCEGSVTEEEYFRIIMDCYRSVSSKIQIISVAEDAVNTRPNERSLDQVKQLSKGRPWQLKERIDHFIKEKEEVFEFSKYPEDEFWIVTDVDENWSHVIADHESGKTCIEKWNEVVRACDEKGYRYAVSNPFFEVWLLLHHDSFTEEDEFFAVSDTHPYEKTDHFRKRLGLAGAALKNRKHISAKHYDDIKIRNAVKRASDLHRDKNDLSPHYLMSTVYLLIRQVLELLPDDA